MRKPMRGESSTTREMHEDGALRGLASSMRRKLDEEKARRGDSPARRKLYDEKMHEEGLCGLSLLAATPNLVDFVC